MPIAKAGGYFRRIATAFGFVVAFGVLLPPSSPAAEPDLSLVSIATGSRGGVYYFAGGTICSRVNAGRWHHGIRCVTEETGGSIENLRALRAGSATFAIVQSDWHHSAVVGAGIFEQIGPDRALRSVFSIYPEAFTVVAGRESGISKLSDLVGKRVNIGPIGSGGRATMDVVMAAMGWEEADFAALPGGNTEAVASGLCDGEIDAAIVTIAHPNLAVEDLLTSCGARLVSVEGAGISELVAQHPYYFSSLISANTYPNQRETVPVFALAATLVTPSRTPSQTVYELVKAVFEDLPGFRATHPAFTGFSVEQMLDGGLSAPLHSGAVRYFKEHDPR